MTARWAAAQASGTEAMTAANGCLPGTEIPRQAFDPVRSPVIGRQSAVPRSAGEMAAGRRLAAVPESVRTAREFAVTTLRRWGLSRLADVAELVVSELVTNALQHGVTAPDARSAGMPPASVGAFGTRAFDDRAFGVRAFEGCGFPIRIRLLAEGSHVMCLVADPSRQIPLLRESGLDEECGRGLQVIDSSCARWGWHLLDEGGKVVWALLARE
jgi:hypothetical protein